MKLEQHYKIRTSAEAFFQALTDSVIVGQWSGAPASVGKEQGNEFSLWGGSIVGYNVKVAPNRLVQQWKEINWASYSTVTFAWKVEEGYLKVTLSQDQIPENDFHKMETGWEKHYMNPLISWLESNNL